MVDGVNVYVVGSNFLARALRTNCARQFGTEPPYDVFWYAEPPKNDTLPTTEALVVLSAPTPIGTYARIQARNPKATIAVVVENVREATATEDWADQPFLVAGCTTVDPRLRELLAPFTKRIIFTTPETAEFTKLAINTMLALQISYGNELGRVAKNLGVDAADVVKALRADPRLGVGYYAPGGPPGEHLMRDVRRLREVGLDIYP